jgi:hypothetical protein
LPQDALKGRRLVCDDATAAQRMIAQHTFRLRNFAEINRHANSRRRDLGRVHFMIRPNKKCAAKQSDVFGNDCALLAGGCAGNIEGGLSRFQRGIYVDSACGVKCRLHR